jgi:putative acetyltransferase
MEIREDDPANPAVATLLAEHVAFGRAHSPPENAHVMDADGLAADAITFWTAWDGDALLGMVALKRLAADEGEVKSMRTATAALRRGVARALLDRLIGEARARGYTRLRLETGTAPAFAPANRLYEAARFIDGPVFGGYPASPHNRFMFLDL